MVEHGFYIIKEEYTSVAKSLGGDFDFVKAGKRPVYCCIRDSQVSDLYWMISTSDISHRSNEQLEKFNRFIGLPDDDLRSCYYHIGKTTRPAVFKISSCYPVIEKYVDHEFVSCGKHVIMRRAETVKEIERKLKRILAFEFRRPNYFPQHITDLKAEMLRQLSATDNEGNAEEDF